MLQFPASSQDFTVWDRTRAGALTCCWPDVQAEQALAAAAQTVQREQEQVIHLQLRARAAARARQLDAVMAQQLPHLEQWHSMQVGLLACWPMQLPDPPCQRFERMSALLDGTAARG